MATTKFVLITVQCVHLFYTIKTNCEFKIVGKYLLVDSEYPNFEWFITSYKTTTYHIPEFRRRYHGLCRREEVFNYTHSSSRTCVERTFRVLNARFKILKEASKYQMEKQVMIPVVCVVIHNFIFINNPSDRLLRQYNLDGYTVHEVDPHARRIYNDRDDDVLVGFVAPNLVVRQDSMSRVKDDMATQMWAAFQQNPWYR